MRYNMHMSTYKRRKKPRGNYVITKEEKKYQFFGNRLQQIMLIRNIQSLELADSPDVEQLSLIAQKLEVSADYLLGLCDDTSVPIRPFPCKDSDA